MNRVALISILTWASACAESHGRLNPGPDVGVGTDSALVDRGVDDVRIWSGANIDGTVTDSHVAQSCSVVFPSEAFVQDQLQRAHDNIITRGALRIAQGGATPPRPLPSPENPLPPMREFIPGDSDRAGNCGSEPVAGYAWDGHRCRGIRTTYCRAANCSALEPNVEQCANEHSTCAPEICRRTGGQWSEVPLSCAGNSWTNGIAPRADCRGPIGAQCICPVNQSPSAIGCAPSTSPLTVEEAGCYASGGTMGTVSPVVCGVVTTRPSIGSACNCGPKRTFDANTHRCEIDSVRCNPALDALCLASGGRWDNDACGHYTCGVGALHGSVPVCDSAGGCNCGALGVYDDQLGCVLAPSCRTNACF